MKAEISFDLGGNRFVPMAERALFWPSQKTLVVSDLHLGKAAVFRARGVPVPAGMTAKDLHRLTTLIQTCNAERLLILGDFLHAKESHEALTPVELWRTMHAGLAIELVPGNHDRSAGRLDPGLGIRLLEAVHVEQRIAFVHDPAEVHELPVVGGHIHPKVRLQDFDGAGLSVPCFVVEPRRMILPAFGSFTGGCRIDHAEGRRLLAAAAGRIIEVARPARPTRAGGAGKTTLAKQ